jgi:hypothetical protein
MTTHYAPHAPHIPPLWRRVLSLPQTIYGWLAVVLAIPVWALWVYGILDPVSRGGGLPGADGVMMGVLFIGPLGVPAALAGLYALEYRHERSWLVWLAIVPLLILLSLVVFWPLSSVLNAGAVVRSILAFLIVVLIVAVIAFWITRADSEEAR